MLFVVDPSSVCPLSTCCHVVDLLLFYLLSICCHSVCYRPVVRSSVVDLLSCCLLSTCCYFICCRSVAILSAIDPLLGRLLSCRRRARPSTCHQVVSSRHVVRSSVVVVPVRRPVIRLSLLDMLLGCPCSTRRQVAGLSTRCTLIIPASGFACLLTCRRDDDTEFLVRFSATDEQFDSSIILLSVALLSCCLFLSICYQVATYQQ